jgi:protoporphyrinogen oxidase
MTTSRTWAVVGGGVLGMRLAARLASAGHDVTVIEAAPDLGGLASAWRLGDVVWDKHYHVIVPTDRRTVTLVEELGLSDQLVWRSVPAGCETAGTVLPATTPREVAALPFLSLTAKVRLALTAARAAVLRDPRSLEDTPVVDWLRRWSGRAATDGFWLPLLRSKLGDNVETTSATFIATTLKRLLRARREGGAAGDGFGYVSGGYAVVLNRMADRLAELGVKTRLGHPVTRIVTTPEGLVVSTADGQDATYDRVVVTAASPVAARMCPELSETERAACSQVTYQGIVCLSLLLAKPLAPYYITYLTEPQPFTAVIDMSALLDPGQLDGRGLVYLPRYVRSEDPLLAASEQEIVDSFVPALRQLYPQLTEEDVLAARLSKVRYVLPVPTLGYSRRLPPVRTSVPGLFLASSALIVDGTLNVNETLAVADGALPTLLEDS